MMSIENETAETVDMTKLTKTFAFLKTWKSHFPNLKHSKCCLLGLYVVLML